MKKKNENECPDESFRCCRSKIKDQQRETERDEKPHSREDFFFFLPNGLNQAEHFLKTKQNEKRLARKKNIERQGEREIQDELNALRMIDFD